MFRNSCDSRNLLIFKYMCSSGNRGRQSRQAPTGQPVVCCSQGVGTWGSDSSCPWGAFASLSRLLVLKNRSAVRHVRSTLHTGFLCGPETTAGGGVLQRCHPSPGASLLQKHQSAGGQSETRSHRQHGANAHTQQPLSEGNSPAEGARTQRG